MLSILMYLAALPVILLGIYIYKKDRNKEPAKLLAKLFIGGILSCFLVLIVSSILKTIFPFFAAESDGMNLIQLFIYVFVGVALVEEVCKWVMVYGISYNNKNFDELYDMIIYSVFVALGFAFFENVLYIFSSGIAGGIVVGIVRALSAVPGHACDGAFMGYYLGLAKLSAINNRQDLSKKHLARSLLVPTILHGIYDYCLFTGNIFFIIGFLVFIIMVYRHTIKNINKIAALTRKMKYKNNYCGNCGHIVNSDYCPMCGKQNE